MRESRFDRASEPRFCPGCNAVGTPSAVLCGDCGASLVPQGYCGVCDTHWRLPVGMPCPKHELPLEPPPGPESEAEAGSRWTCGHAHDLTWVTVGRYGDPLRAEVPRIRLEAEGIPTFVEGGRMGGPSMYQVATGGVKLQVPASLAADARVLLAQTWSPAFDPDSSGDDLDDAWDELAPDAGAIWRDVGRAAVLFVLVAPLLASLLAAWLGAH
jgi:hypothetical protein